MSWGGAAAARGGGATAGIMGGGGATAGIMGGSGATPATMGGGGGGGGPTPEVDCCADRGAVLGLEGRTTGLE